MIVGISLQSLILVMDVSPLLIIGVGYQLMSSHQVRRILRDDTDDSYVSREKALSGGLAFWTKEGIPGIQVSTSRSSFLFPHVHVSH